MFYRNKPILSILSAIMLLSLTFMGAPGTAAQNNGSSPSRVAPTDIDELRLPDQETVNSKIRGQLDVATGRVSVVVRLGTAPVSLADNPRAQADAISAEQDAIIAHVSQIDSSARVLGRVKLLLNAVMFEIDAAKLGSLATDARVVTITPVVNFQLDLSETVPYIGGAAVGAWRQRRARGRA